MGRRRRLVCRVTAPILVTGGTGQLAQALLRANPGRVRVVGRPEFDFDQPDTVAAAVQAHRPAVVINAAAYTAVDAAEAAPEAAARANADGPARLAQACRALSIPLIHVSTDYVFDGLKSEPYIETDPTTPAGVYGRTKLAGEVAVRAAHPGAVILRTSWVYARHGRNFVLTMLNAGKRAPRLRVVADQLGCPTNADDLAAACLIVADRLLAVAEQPGRSDSCGGIYHAAGQGDTSWHGFAEAIFAEAGRYGWPQPPIDPIATTDWPTPAARPANSRLNCNKLAKAFGARLPDWRVSLASAVEDICSTDAAATATPG